MLLSTVAHNIRHRRRTQTVSLEQCCRGSGLSEAEWRQAERGSNLTLAQLCIVADVLQCAPHQLLDEGYAEPDYTLIERCIPHFMPDCAETNACFAFDTACRDLLQTCTLYDVQCAGYGCSATYDICETPRPKGMSYGIHATYLSDYGSMSYSAPDVCPNRSELERFVRLLNLKQPSRLHFHDLIEDFTRGYKML